MAAKKKETAVAKEYTLGADTPWGKVVKIKLPKERRGEPNFITVGLNGKMWKLQKGVDLLVPEGVAEIIEHSEQAREEADEYLDGLN